MLVMLAERVVVDRDVVAVAVLDLRAAILAIDLGRNSVACRLSNGPAGCGRFRLTAGKTSQPLRRYLTCLPVAIRLADHQRVISR